MLHAQGQSGLASTILCLQNRMQRLRWTRQLSTAACVLALAACKDSGSPEPDRFRLGVYALQSIGGMPLPFTLSDEFGLAFISLSDTLVMLEGGVSYEVSVYLRRAQGQADTVRSTGRASARPYSVVHDTIVFADQGAGGDTALYAAGQLRVRSRIISPATCPAPCMLIYAWKGR